VGEKASEERALPWVTRSKSASAPTGHHRHLVVRRWGIDPRRCSLHSLALARHLPLHLLPGKERGREVGGQKPIGSRREGTWPIAAALWSACDLSPLWAVAERRRYSESASFYPKENVARSSASAAPPQPKAARNRTHSITPSLRSSSIPRMLACDAAGRKLTSRHSKGDENEGRGRSPIREWESHPSAVALRSSSIR